jgi:hypothetical protein
VFAATALTPLKRLIAADHPACQGDALAICWPNDIPPSGTLLIAVYVPAGCDQGRVTGASKASGGRVLTLQVSVRNLQCPRGAGTQPAPLFSLVSVPLDQLPTGVLTVRVHYLGTLTIGPLAQQPLDAQTTAQTG